MRKPPKCPTCGTPLPRTPDPALPSERGKRPDATREILRRLTVLEQRVAVADPHIIPPEDGSEVHQYDGEADA